MGFSVVYHGVSSITISKNVFGRWNNKFKKCIYLPFY